MVNTRLLLVLLPLVCVVDAKAQLSFDDRKAQQQAQRELLQGENELRALRQSSQTSGLPAVISIAGLEGKKLVVRLQLTNGNVGEFMEGDLIESGIAIASVTPRQVTVKVGSGKSSKSLPLYFVSGAQAGAGQPVTPLSSGVITDLLTPLPAVLVGQRPIPAPTGTTANVQPVNTGSAAVTPTAAVTR